MSTALSAAPSEWPEALALTPSRLESGHLVEPLFGGAEAYPAMLGAISTAQEEVALETYIWAGDASGRRFVDAVCEKAHQGVRVRCIIDGAGSFGFPGDAVDQMRDAGVRLSVFHPVGPWRRRWGWQVRDHRKLLLVDRRVAFTGGLNLGDDYAPREWGGKEWHDVHVRVEGPVVRELHRFFELTWKYAVPETWEPRRRRKHAPARAPTTAIAIHGATARVQALAVGTGLGRRTIHVNLQHTMAAARSRIWIQAAYFVPNRALRNSLRRAARRGVDVRVMVPRHGDVPGIGAASRYTWGRLLKSGVRMFEWVPSMLHSKTMAVDGMLSSIGSYNLDQRSMAYNWELQLAILDPPTAGKLERRFEEDLAQCEEVDPVRWKKRGLWARIQERFFYLFRSWL